MPVFNNKEFDIHHGDCITHMMDEMPESSVDFSIFSPPFPALYAYSDSECDIGNVDSMGDEAKLHLSFFFNGLARVLKPGRAAIVHVMQIPRMKRSGGVGLFDFRGLNIRLGERAGLVYEYDWSVRKNPQSQAIRTRSRELQFSGLESDRAGQRGTLQDYLIKFRKPGDNARKINAKHQVTRNDWIDWAEGCWHDIHETDTLNTKAAKSDEDTRHICPLQLEVIRRCVLLYSDPGEIVFSPFAGIGSEGYVALGGKSPKTRKLIADPRRFYGCELKPEYHQQAIKNCRTAIAERSNDEQNLLFAELK
ncbi:DNA-methyltransferase [Planctomycetes bacterium TBK1r]|uniref:Methyltransferase n=1 Tax=Stieleria magnilauensis TaxID=2527963 RepID=A0ABX5Y0I1_9BACT|nr:DNA methylase [Planctomycetes bacterium TBK1r]QDV87036.1 DNA methylase [Planctomycetes bacterium TBK1r]